MIECIKGVLADPGQYHPAYDKGAGYEIAGFVWFQGFNDLVNRFYKDKKVPEGENKFAPYAKQMASFIRDLRKDLNKPKTKFILTI